MKFLNKNSRRSFVTASTFAPLSVNSAKQSRLDCFVPTYVGTRNDSGVSLIITVLFVSALMLVLAGLAEVHIKTIRNIANRENASKVIYLAETVENIAGYLAGNRGSGWNSSDADMAVYENMISESARDMGVSACTAVSPCMGMEIKGRPDTAGTLKLSGKDYYSAPAKGTGNAAEKCTISPADNNFSNDPCNWNKLYVGDTVEIPLYYKDAAGEHRLLPLTSGTQYFKLRVRAPGHPSNRGDYLFPEWSDTADPYRHILKDPVLMQWMIYGAKAGISKALIANDGKDNNKTFRNMDLILNNTEISGGRINEGALNGGYISDFIVLAENHQGKLVSTDSSTTDEAPPIKAFDVDYPILRLNLVGQPKKNSVDGKAYEPATDSNDFRFNFPYLEYQVLANTPFADAKSTITGWAQVGDYRKEFKKYVKREATLGGFAFEQF